MIGTSLSLAYSSNSKTSLSILVDNDNSTKYKTNEFIKAKIE